MRVEVKSEPLLKMAGVTALVALLIVVIVERFQSLDSWIIADLVHIPQFVIPFLIIFYLTKGRLREYGFNLRQVPPVFTHKRMFVIGLIVGALMSLRYVPGIVGSTTLDVPQPINLSSIAGNLTFQWIIIGVCEETMFRGLIQTYLIKHLEGNVKIFGHYLHIGTVFAALFWGMFHFINVLIMPLESVVFLVILTTVIGLPMGYAYQETGSLFTTIVVHNTLFGVHLTIGYVINWLL